MLQQLLQRCEEAEASDMHLIEGEPPVLRIHGQLHRTQSPPLTKSQLEAMLDIMLTPMQQETFAQYADIDFAFTMPETDRFRVNAHRDRGTIGIALRRLPKIIPSLPELGLPPTVAEFASAHHGLILLTGPVGMGKSTTLASLVELINLERNGLIITIEDPIEYRFTSKRCIIKQREVTVDTPSFAMALKHALRQDPNVIVIGEVRDIESIAIALTAAETGHLILATMHAPDTQHAIERIVDVFPADKQPQILLQLSGCLVGVVTQMLLPHVSGHGRVLAAEVLVGTPGVRNMIREHQLEQIPSAIQMGGRRGMQTMDKALRQLVDAKQITMDIALAHARHPDDFQPTAEETPLPFGRRNSR